MPALPRRRDHFPLRRGGGGEDAHLSLSMPRSLQVHKQRAARAYLEGLLPDNPGALSAIATAHNTSPRSIFGMLAGVGREVPGALQLLTPGTDPDEVAHGSPTGIEIDDDAIAERLKTAIEVYRDGRTARHVDFRFSLPGAQAKIALTRTPDGRWLVPDRHTATTHILKPASDDQPLPDMDVAEAITLEAARRLGLDVPRTSSWRSPDGSLSALLVERYDRRYDESGSIRRLHQEDLTQALSIPPSKKYQSDGGPGVGKVAELIRGRIAPRDQHAVARSFFEGFAFTIAVLGTDAHAKNYSLLIERDRVTLAPLYDLVSAGLYYDADTSSRTLRPSMWVGGERSFERISPQSLTAEGMRLGLKHDEAAEVVSRMLNGATEALVSAASDAGRHDMAASAERNLTRFSPARFSV
ncbi:MAG: HipA domain-containing protein [Microbacterium sp.]